MKPPYALAFDAASYLISGLLLLSIRRPFGRRRHELDRLGIRADVGEGLRFLWQQPVIRTLTFSVFCVCLSWGGVFALLVVYADRALHLARVDVRLAQSLPIRLTFGLLAISAVVGAGLAGWSCLGSRPLAAVSVSAPDPTPAPVRGA